MKHLLNQVRKQALMVQGNRATVRIGLISSYDASNYAVKVRLQPEDIESNWMPLCSPWIGNGWGMFCAPTIGDAVEVQFEEGSQDVAFACMRFYNDVDRPLDVPSGEFWLVHLSGSCLKFKNDGTVELQANQDLNITAENVNITGKLSVTGDIEASGDIADLSGARGSLNHIRDAFNPHYHEESGGGNTHGPNNPIS